jgi:hypothetical protein
VREGAECKEVGDDNEEGSRRVSTGIGWKPPAAISFVRSFALDETTLRILAGRLFDGRLGCAFDEFALRVLAWCGRCRSNIAGQQGKAEEGDGNRLCHDVPLWGEEGVGFDRGCKPDLAFMRRAEAVA